MAYLEYNIDRRYRLYGRYYHTLSETLNANPFLASHRTVLDANGQPALTTIYNEWKRLDNLPDLFAQDTSGDKFIPLNFQLVIPSGVGTAPYPLAVFIHGQSNTYFDENDLPTAETKSYRGYRYLQHYLAERGIASVSVNVNVASFLENPNCGHADYEPQNRIQIAFLVLAALKQLQDGAVTQGQPIRFKKTDGTVVALQDALALTGPFSTGSQEALVHALKTALQGKLSFTNLGFMGHSRGANTVQLLQPYFTARTGTAPADYATLAASTTATLTTVSGTYNSNTLLSDSDIQNVQTIAHQYHAIQDLATIIGNPRMEHLKVVVSLQPSEYKSLLDSPTTFFLLVASSHDEDVNNTAINGYENPNCPKAMIFSHGASHSRFNTVWRQIPGLRAKVMGVIRCQSPIRMLSNSGHENLAKATIGNAMLAAMLGQNHRYRFYCDQFRATSLGQDIERAWKFPFPIATPPALVVMDDRSLAAFNVTSNLNVDIVDETDMDSRDINGGDAIYANTLDTKRITKPANAEVKLAIPVTTADSLVSRSHFSFRYTKEYDSHDSSIRSSVNLRNYSLRLMAGSRPFGRVIAGADVPTQVQRAYPRRQDADNGVDFIPCADLTAIVMQTAEVPLSQFLNTGQPVSDLSQVTGIEIVLLASPRTSGDEHYFFVDFLLTSRPLPAPPSGFEIP